MNKKVFSIILIYFIQLIATSCVPSCSCNKIKTFERTYNSVALQAWDTSGFQNEEVVGTAYKNAFGLSISVQFELNQISYLKPIFNIRSLGFTAAYATSDCDCPSDAYINVDPIESIIITTTDTQTQEEQDVTNNFSAYNYNGEQETISELFENRADWHDGFQVDMTEYDNIPDSAIFTVKIILASGAELIENTQEIHFE